MAVTDTIAQIAYHIIKTNYTHVLHNASLTRRFTAPVHRHHLSTHHQLTASIYQHHMPSSPLTIIITSLQQPIANPTPSFPSKQTLSAATTTTTITTTTKLRLT